VTKTGKYSPLVPLRFPADPSASVAGIYRRGCATHVGEEASAHGFEPCDDEGVLPATARQCAIEAAREMENEQARLCGKSVDLTSAVRLALRWR